jgi:hypothetical protein
VTTRPMTLAALFRAWFDLPRVRRLTYETRSGYRRSATRFVNGVRRRYAPELRGREPDASYLARDVARPVLEELVDEHGPAVVERIRLVVDATRRALAPDLDADEGADEPHDEGADDAAE